MKIVRAVKVCKTVMNQPSDLEGSYVEVVTDRKVYFFGGWNRAKGHLSVYFVTMLSHGR